MAAKTCVDCGATLTPGNSTFIRGRCLDCYRVPLARTKAFLDRTPLTEQDIQNWQFSKSLITLLGNALFLYACIVVGSLVGFGRKGTYQGLLYAFIATILGILVFRWRMNSTAAHPLTTSRWYNFAFPFSFILFFSWFIAYAAWMPASAGRLVAAGPIFSHRVLVTPTLAVPAFVLVLLVGIAALIVGAAVGFWNALRQEKKNKTHLLAQYQRWQQSKA